MDTDTARTELHTAAEPLLRADCGCTPREVARVIDAALSAGARNPRSIRPRRDDAA